MECATVHVYLHDIADSWLLKDDTEANDVMESGNEYTNVSLCKWSCPLFFYIRDTTVVSVTTFFLIIIHGCSFLRRPWVDVDVNG